MFRCKYLFKVKYKIVEVEPEVFASPASLRLDMRAEMKEKFPGLYFSKSPDEASKNLGCHFFGQPETWRGIICAQPNFHQDEEGWYEVLFGYEPHRAELSEDRVKEIIRKILTNLKDNLGIVKNIEEI